MEKKKRNIFMPSEMSNKIIEGISICKYSTFSKNNNIDKFKKEFDECDIALISYGNDIGRNITGQMCCIKGRDEIYIKVDHPKKDDILSLLRMPNLLEKIGYYEKKTGAISNWCIFKLIHDELGIEYTDKKSKEVSKEMSTIIIYFKRFIKLGIEYIQIKFKYYLKGEKEKVITYYKKDGVYEVYGNKFNISDDKYEMREIEGLTYFLILNVVSLLNKNFLNIIKEVSLDMIIKLINFSYNIKNDSVMEEIDIEFDEEIE